MKTNVRDTSIESYHKIENLGDKQQKVLLAIQDLGRCTDRQIATRLGWEINRVTGRRNELDKGGYIRAFEKTHDAETNRNVWLWEVTRPIKDSRQIDMFPL